MSIPAGAEQANTSISEFESQNHFMPLMWLTTLFFMWGFITCLNDILIPHLKSVFDLNYTQAMLIQFCFFGAYFVVSIPAGKLVKKAGFKSGIILGLLVAGVGCLLFYPAASFRVYGIFLVALFVLASGITILQVSANPFVTILGKPKTASSRLTMTQAFNSLGTTIAPALGGFLILAGVAEGLSGEEAKLQAISTVQGPYLILAGILVILAAVFAMIRLPRVPQERSAPEDDGLSAWSHRHLVLGAVGIFVYVGAEVSIGSFLVNFLGESNIAGLKEVDAAKYVGFYWGCAMIGRFVGAAILQRISGGMVLALSSIAACVLVLVAMIGNGLVAMYAILAVGMCNAVMFPIIFSLAIKGLGSHTSQGSGILCMAIVGGAIVPLVQGVFADIIGIQLAFFIPVLCYIYIVFYGFKGSTIKGQENTNAN